MNNYNPMELMICVASRLLEDNAVVSVGTGAPCAAAMLAQKLYSPNLIIMFEAGGVSPMLPSMPISVGDSYTMHKALQTTSILEVMDALQRGLVEYCFLGGAQIDMYGNLNSTLIGDDYYKPKVRLPGSGGACDFASLANKILVITPQSKRRFVKKVDFITTPGYLSGSNTREMAGLPPNTGPYKVITNLAIYSFENISKRMKIESIHPGVTLKDIEDNTDFELLKDEKLAITTPPTEDELRILRKDVDPLKIIIGRQAY